MASDDTAKYVIAKTLKGQVSYNYSITVATQDRTATFGLFLPVG